MSALRIITTASAVALGPFTTLAVFALCVVFVKLARAWGVL